MLIPTGFWSYTSSDEKASRGKLSQLRALLAEELQQQIGRLPVVNIFQDVAAIPPGRDWEKQINESLEASSFLIPVITPAYLQSEWCCYEIAAFREREARHGSSGLIFPIHFVDTLHVDGNDPHDCHDAEVAAFLRSRQWIDFRHLRLRNFDSEDVAVLLERLAKSIRTALRDAKTRANGTNSVPRPEPPTVAPSPKVAGGKIAAPLLAAGSTSDADPKCELPSPTTTTALRKSAAPSASALTRDGGGPTDAAEQFKLALRHASGQGVMKDDRAAAEWCRKAAEQGHATAQYNLGLMYAVGRGVIKDEGAATEWYSKAVRQGNAAALRAIQRISNRKIRTM